MDHKYKQDTGIFVHISSLYRVDKPDSKYGNGQFKVTAATGTFPTVDRIIPDVITIPNLFPNINQYRNSYEIIDQLSESEFPQYGKSVPIGEWTINQYVNLLNAENPSWFTMQISNEQDVTKVRVTNNGTGSFPFWVVGTLEWFNLIGFTAAHPNLELFSAQSSPTRSTTTKTQFQPGIPLYILRVPQGDPLVSDSQTNMGGESVLFVTMDHMGKNAGMEADSGNPTNAVACVPVPGEQGGRIVLDNQNGTLPAINFRKPMNINSNIISIRDAAGRVLYIPPTHHVHLNMKAVKLAGSAGTFF